MKIMTWNIRGLGGIEKRRAVKENCCKYKLDVVVLQETKKAKFSPLLMCSVVGRDLLAWCIIPSCGTMGGVLLVWDLSVVDKIDELVGSFSISIVFKEMALGFQWMFTGIYGPSSPYNRHLFWEELFDVRDYWQGPWVIGGDFNVIWFVHEKSTPTWVTRSMRDFGAFVNECSVQDCPILNVKFTWTNDRDPPIFCKLDRFLCTNDWEELYPRFFLEGIPKVASDHWPVMLNTSKLNWGSSPFCFENTWTTHPSFIDIVRRWSRECVVDGWEGFRFMKKIHFIKEKLRVWNLESFGRLSIKKNEIWKEIQLIDNLILEQGVVTVGLTDKKKELLTNLDGILKCEEIHYSQKTKCKWLKEGDGNTKFFHKVANGKNLKNYIAKLVIKGEMVEDLDKIKNEAIRFYSTLYLKEEGERPFIDNSFSNSLGEVEVVSLEVPLTKEEVKKAIFGMAKDKSPGPDGFSMCFYHVCLDIIMEDLLKVLEEFYASGIINVGTNATFFILIPKKKGAVELSDFRPISLVTSLYKIIVKVLSLRLRKFMGLMVDSTQGAFVKGRQITDGILIALECVDWIKKEKKSGLACKIDMEKAYDRVVWVFLRWVLSKKCFGAKWIGWIMGCLDHPHFSIMLNDISKGFFSSSRGIRQGDPLSPFLFTLVVDAFSALMSKALLNSLIDGFGVGRDGIRISHL